MPDVTNAELAERLEEQAAIWRTEADASLDLGDVAGLGKQNAEACLKHAEHLDTAADRLRKPLQFRWEGHVLILGDGSVGELLIYADGVDIHPFIGDVDPPPELFPTKDDAKSALEDYITSQVTGGGS